MESSTSLATITRWSTKQHRLNNSADKVKGKLKDLMKADAINASNEMMLKVWMGMILHFSRFGLIALMESFNKLSKNNNWKIKIKRIKIWQEDSVSVLCCFYDCVEMIIDGWFCWLFHRIDDVDRWLFIEGTFTHALQYEDIQLQQKALSIIPVEAIRGWEHL